MRIRTTISTVVNLWDLNGNWLPMGNYYFLIKKINKKGHVIGDLSNKTFKGVFTFKSKDVFKMMAIAQSILSRKSGFSDEMNMPNYPSPPSSPIADFPTHNDFDVLINKGGNNSMHLFNSSGESIESLNLENRETENEIIENGKKNKKSVGDAKFIVRDYQLNKESLQLQRDYFRSMSESILPNIDNVSEAFLRQIKCEKILKLRQKEERLRKEAERKESERKEAERKEAERKCKEDERKRKEDERKRKEEDNKCMVCLVEIKSDMKVLPCAHKYHSHCINKWLTFKSNCPQCRQEVNQNQLRSLSSYRQSIRGRRYDSQINSHVNRHNLPSTNRYTRFQVYNDGISSYNSVINEARRVVRRNYRM
tara:strand:+ start:793 stop:1890 length:1098 start_codon:yes stop_codon:yes gene_type:complete